MGMASDGIGLDWIGAGSGLIMHRRLVRDTSLHLMCLVTGYVYGILCLYEKQKEESVFYYPTCTCGNE